MENKAEVKYLKVRQLDKESAMAAAFIRGYSTVSSEDDTDLLTEYVHDWVGKSESAYLSRQPGAKDQSMVLIFADSTVSIIKKDGRRMAAIATDSISLTKFFDANNGHKALELGE